MKIFGVVSVLVLLGVCYFLLAHHIVNTDSGRLIVKKKGLGLAETFVDTRGWTPEDIDTHQAVRDALIAAGRGDVVDRIARTEEEGLEEPSSGSSSGAPGGVIDPLIESQSSSGSQKTGARLKERAKAAGGD